MVNGVLDQVAKAAGRDNEQTKPARAPNGRERAAAPPGRRCAISDCSPPRRRSSDSNQAILMSVAALTAPT